ncbi:hypothetical protein ACFYMO_00765 [Streptomyces sp. NPDC007025]|uniref:hypothetical protein n=1 Tax=Streptomyces sp. NPDC007025 TaxID=3364771 RepID=UPI00367AC630
MKVFRVGHATKTRDDVGRESFPVGPYNGVDWDEMSEGHEAMVWAHSGWGSESHHPAPFHDAALCSIQPWEVCGFVSLEALLDWFESYLKVLDESQFRVWVYELPDDVVRVGRFGQAVFPTAGAVGVESFRLPLADQQLALF